ncbi:TPA: Crp/Fnr family transcriptional regulator [Pseudomonas aeruginosa]|nr:Crp/Fnr family transcriptional regulator [Pseudomonas aeruginosa]HBO3334071.1 Crp/Fnr family transcriptional regulator [Pseudomonas aeruginosa]
MVSPTGYLEFFRDVLIESGVKDIDVIEGLLSRARVSRPSKNTTIIDVGQIPGYFYLIVKGMARYFYQSPNGKEWNKAFFREREWVGSLSSYLTEEPCAYSIGTLEDCVLISVPVALFKPLSSIHPDLKMLIHIKVQEMMLRNEQREAILLTENSEDRYRWLCKKQPWLLERVAQYHLASYLGIEPGSLSRLKRSIALG